MTDVSIQPIQRERVLIPIMGIAPLIVHNWSEKAKRQMLDAMQGKKKVREIKDPEADYQSSFYRTDTGFGFPALAFKDATVKGGGRLFGKNARMTELRACLYVRGLPSADKTQLLTPIVGEPRLREDVVRVGINGTDLRYRGEFLEWSTLLDVTYVTTSLSLDSVLSLVDAGGMAIGVGEWRPEKSGQNGTYEIDRTREIEVMEATS